MKKITKQEIFNNFGKALSCNDILNSLEHFQNNEKKEIMQFIYEKQRDFWHEYANFYTYFFPKLPFVPEHIDLLIEDIDPQTGEVILDLGSGYGRIIKKIIEHCPDVQKVIGLEYAKGMLMQAKEILGEKLNSSQVNLIHHDVIKPFPLPDQSADKVYSNWGITYSFQNDLEEKIFPEIRRVLKPGGKLIITSLHRDSDMPGMRKKMSFINFLKILRVVKQAVSFGKKVKVYFPSYSIDELVSMINNNGFEVAKKHMTLFNNSVTIVAKKK